MIRLRFRGQFAARSIFMNVAATGVRWRPATP